MSNVFELTAETRETSGTGAARRMRHDEKVPAIVYGAGQEPQHITLIHKDISLALKHEAVYSHILTLNVAGKSEQVVLKSIDRHPSRPIVMHVDFLRVNVKEKLTMHVPLHFLGEEDAPGMKEGGVLSKPMTDVEVSCLPADLPESIDVDISMLVMDQVLHASDIKLPKGVEMTMELDEEHNPPLVGIHMPRVEVEPEEEAAEEGEEGAEEAKAEEGAEEAPAASEEDKKE